MDSENFEIVMRTLNGRRPFRPFTLELVNGKRLEVDFPNAIAFREGVGVHLGPGKEISLLDHAGVARVIDDLSHAEDEAGGGG